MNDDPVRYWQDLTDAYRQMSDGELLALAETPEELTDVAQQVLRDELRKRRLDEPAASPETPSAAPFSAEQLDEQPAEGHEYTWKVQLAECDSPEKAWQLAETLRRAGIESWMQRNNPFTHFEAAGPAVLVAADQLEQARAIAAQPIPQDIVAESQLKVPEYILPACPQCGSRDDAVLQSVDPVNTWACDACGAEWTDADQPEA